MKYSIAPEVVQMFPEFKRGVVVALGIDNSGHSEQIQALLRGAEEKTRQDDSLAEITAHPRIANWRNAYVAFGVKPGKFPPSIEALIRRVRKGDDLPYINDMVAFCNYISLKHIVPVGGHALDDCEGDMYVRAATGDEPFRPLGTAEVEHPLRGEIVLTDDHRVLTRRWTWRQAEATKVMPETTKIEINVDRLPPVSRDEVERIMCEITELVGKYFRPSHVVSYLLEASNPQIEFEV